jgi:hypothetical protein
VVYFESLLYQQGVFPKEKGRHGELLHEKKHDQFKQGKVAIGTWSAQPENWHLDDFRINGPGISPDAVNLQDKPTTTWGQIKNQKYQAK